MRRAHPARMARPVDWILAYFWDCRGYFLVGACSLVVTNVFQALVPWILKEAIENLQTRPLRYALWAPPAAMVGVALVAGITRTLSRGLIYAGCREVEYRLRDDVIAHLLTLPISYYRSGRVGDIISRASSDTSEVRMLVGAGSLQVINTVCTYLATLSLMLALDARLTMYVLVPYVILVFVFNRMSLLTHRYSVRVQEQLGNLSTQVQESLAGMMILKSFRLERFEADRFAGQAAELRRRELKFALVRSLLWPFVGLVSGLSVIMVLFIGGRAVIQGRMSLGELVAFHSYLILLLWPTLGLGWIVNVIQRGLAAAGRIHEVFRAASEPSTLDPAVRPAAGRPAGADRDGSRPESGGIEITALSFAYPGREDAGLTDVTLRIEPGSHVALVGRTGSGKSTLALLLVRLINPPPDSIHLDGIDVTATPLDDLRRQVVLLPQEAYLFSISIIRNILYPRPDEAAAQAIRAAEVAHVAGEFRSFPHGFDTMVGERGVTLSGGQRQRTSLARSLIQDSRVLVLDDAFSSVDTHTERGILEAILELRRGRTTIIISHRVSTVREADHIFVLDHGRLVEDGPHARLARAGGPYARMVRHQSLVQSLEEPDPR